MIKKSQLQSVISKYHLNGLIESVKWKIKNDSLTIDFMSPNRDMIGKVEFDTFKVKDCELAIFDTTQLNKLLAITTHEFLIEPTKTKLLISDNYYNLQYSLADPLLIEKVGSVTNQEYNIEFILSQEQIGAIIKAIEALPNSNTICLKKTETIMGDDALEFVFGENQEYANKITYPIDSIMILKPTENFNIPFTSEVIKNIFKSNRDCDDIQVKMNTGGLIHLKFLGEEIRSEYFVIRRQDY
jgi:hypothetical protein